MGSNRDDGAMISGSQEAGCSDATVEIKIKTLDSKTYTLQVDKHVPVLALKEHIATVTGIDSEEQHLLCRGKVLKDDQLLSAFYVEDGHSLYLVVRQPTSPSSVSLLDFPATYPASSAGNMQALEVTVSVVVGTFNIAEGVDELELNQIILPVLNSLVTDTRSNTEGVHIGASNSGTESSSRQADLSPPQNAKRQRRE